MEKELEYLGRAMDNPEKPFIAILGGAKVSDKMAVIENLLTKVDTLIVGGAMAYTFLKAQGQPVGKSRVEEDKLDLAKQILGDAKARKVKFLLPVDHVVADRIDASARADGKDDTGEFDRARYRGGVGVAVFCRKFPGKQ